MKKGIVYIFLVATSISGVQGEVMGVWLSWIGADTPQRHFRAVMPAE